MTKKNTKYNPKSKSKEQKLDLFYVVHKYKKNSHITNNINPLFPTKWGDIGIIPNNLNHMIHNLKVKEPKALKSEIIDNPLTHSP